MDASFRWKEYGKAYHEDSVDCLNVESIFG